MNETEKKGINMKYLLFAMLLSGVFCLSFGANDLLILHCEGGATLNGVENNIGNDPFYGSVDYLDGSVALVLLATLLNYDCVFTWNNYQYMEGQGDQLADYVDAGGKVVIIGWGISQCLGRIIDDANYCPIVGGGNMFVNTDLGTTYAHPVLYGVSSISNIYFWVTASLESGATLIAENTNGQPLAAINSAETVIALNMVAGDYMSWSGDGWILFNNAIQYLMGLTAMEQSTWGSIKSSF